MNMLRSVLGVAVALIGAFVVFGIPQQALLNSLYPPVGTAVLLFEIILLAILSGGLLRSWWALLIVPVVFGIGFFLSNVIAQGGIDLVAWAASGFEGVDIFVVLLLTPLAVGAAIGVALSKWVLPRLHLQRRR